MSAAFGCSPRVHVGFNPKDVHLRGQVKWFQTDLRREWDSVSVMSSRLVHNVAILWSEGSEDRLHPPPPPIMG